MVDSPVLVGNACIGAYQRLLAECIRFKAAELYFLRLEYGAMEVGGEMKEAHDGLMARLAPDYQTPSSYFIERSYILLVAAFELFLQELVQAIVMQHPKKVGRTEFKLHEILDSGSTDELIRRAIEETLNKLMYKKPMEYLSDIADLLSIDEAPLRDTWPIFAEAKARRDLGVHNGWKCNSIYLRKITEAGLTSTYAIGERLFPPPNGYLDTVNEALSTLASKMMDAVIAKHSKTLDQPLK